MKRNNKLNKRKQEITLMTILANEADKESRHILKKYNKPNARDHADLEVKLAELYFEQDDKLAIEKDLAEIHPHKNWIVRTLDLIPKSEVKCETCEEKKTKDETDKNNIEEIKTAVSDTVSKFSDFNGSNAPQPVATECQNCKRPSSAEMIGMLGAIGLIGLTFIVVSKNLTK